MLKVINGKIYVEEVETTDAELIGMAFKDFAEKLHNKKQLDCNFDLSEGKNSIEFRSISSSYEFSK